MNLDDLDDEWGTRMALRKPRWFTLQHMLAESTNVMGRRFMLTNDDLNRILKRQHLLRSELNRRAEVHRAKVLGLPYPNEF